MKNIHLRVIIVLLIIITLTTDCYTQVDKSTYYSRGKMFYYNYFYMPADEGDSIEVITIYKIAYDLLKFEKKEKAGYEEMYISTPEFEVEFRDSEGIIRKRDRKIDTIITEDYSLINRNDFYYYGTVRSKLSSQKYSPKAYLWDESNVKLGEKKLPELDLSGYKTKLKLSSPLLCYKENVNINNYTPYILDRNATFTSKNILMFFLTTSEDDDVSYDYSIEYMDKRRSGIEWQGETKQQNSAKVYYDKGVEFIEKRGEKPQFLIKEESPKKKGYTGVVEIVLTADKIMPGKYELKVWNKSGGDSLNFEFEIVWENMPITLKNPEYAAEIMYYVLTDEEYEEIKSGADREIMRKMFEWWKKRDPTRFTIYNEAMAEYFRRADYAFFNYKTIYEKDGAKSSRGKIYILKGPPSNISKKMKADGNAIEMWRYDRLKQSYIFETDKNGVVYLKEIQDYKD